MALGDFLTIAFSHSALCLVTTVVVSGPNIIATTQTKSCSKAFTEAFNASQHMEFNTFCISLFHFHQEFWKIGKNNAQALCTKRNKEIANNAEEGWNRNPPQKISSVELQFSWFCWIQVLYHLVGFRIFCFWQQKLLEAAPCLWCVK